MPLLSTWFTVLETIIHSPKVPPLCGLPYPNHPKGCPNYNTNRGDCPPNAPYITDLLDLSRPVFMVWSEFDLAKHVEDMRKKYNDWTERQLRNVLYWQSRSKRQLESRARKLMILTGCDTVTYKPEANGVNVYVTASKTGLKLEKIKHLKTCHHIALIGYSPNSPIFLNNLPETIKNETDS